MHGRRGHVWPPEVGRRSSSGKWRLLNGQEPNYYAIKRDREEEPLYICR